MSSLVISLLGVVWTMILTIGGISAYEAIGPGTSIVFIFSYYWVSPLVLQPNDVSSTRLNHDDLPT